MKLIGSEKMPPGWAKRLDELIETATAGERFGVVGLLDALVKGYNPRYEYHKAPADEDASKSLH